MRLGVAPEGFENQLVHGARPSRIHKSLELFEQPGRDIGSKSDRFAWSSHGLLSLAARDGKRLPEHREGS